MNVIIVILAFIAGAFYGYARSIEHCDRCHPDDPNDGPTYYRANRP